ncbi:MAG: tRNA uridine-5-carboxymethylaminomethyl(34) synthesis GTPase MnmE [Gammaproteobacteria bacterium]|nr:tRNA uridine-5-carboxymethylaminomethyl(34) synthesis GTPase MnmE [Gammaproteobacteria bacterium]
MRDTIAAIATPPGRGGIGIVRVSGQHARSIAEAVAGRVPDVRQATYACFRDGDGRAIDRGIVLFYVAPASFTGEDVVEFQGHGGPVVLEALLERVCDSGARIARPGEFTERAFLNDKMDLAQAEAVADLIDSASRRAARSAMRSLDGAFSRRVMAIDQAVLHVRVFLEAAIDFAEEEVDFLADRDVVDRLVGVTTGLRELLVECRQGQVLRDGFDVVIAGPPNAGKSSLLNRLLAENRAIVTDIPGTTRDLLFADAELDGIPVRLTDTAGLREGRDAVEEIGIERARGAAAAADLVLFVVDDTSDGCPSPPEVSGARIVHVRNKVDLSGGPPGLTPSGDVRVSALTGAGLDALREVIVTAAGVAPGEGTFLARKRHVLALSAAVERVATARGHVEQGYGDLAAEEMREAQHALGTIVGATSVDDLLGEIFSSFCIGK